MRVRIEPHLERFEAISQLKKLIIEYGKLKSSGLFKDTENSFEDYLYSQSLDPVKRFLHLCIPQSQYPDYDQMINYWSSKFQTFRGTLKIFDYLQEMGGVMGILIGKGSPGDNDYIPPYKYDTKTLEVNFTEVETTDMNLFVKTGTEFFKALLYFQDLRDTYKTIKLDLTSEIYINLSSGSQFYSTHIIEDNNEI